ncbi:MAG: hypothetical protein AB8G11_23130 [Saprospiraceae bacterium]
MKKLLLFIVCVFFTLSIFGQEEETYEMYPLNWFVRVSPGMFAINSTPATMDLFFLDDDIAFPDSAFGTLETNNMWSYGLNAEVSYLMNGDFTVSHNAFFGIGANGMFTYSSNLEFGRELPFGKLFVQPRIGISYIHTSLRIDEFFPFNKDFFQVNNRFIYDGMRAKLKSRAFAVTPSVIIDYPINNYVSIFTKVGGHYSFGRRSYLTFIGETDEVDSEGDYITAHENRNFNHPNIDFSIDGQQLVSRQSPYLNYNFNSFFVQFGLTIRLMEFYE